MPQLSHDLKGDLAADRAAAITLIGGTVSRETWARLDRFVDLLIERQQKFVAVCDKLADALGMAPYAQAAAREAVGEAKGHLENLQELKSSPDH